MLILPRGLDAAQAHMNPLRADATCTVHVWFQQRAEQWCSGVSLCVACDDVMESV